MNKIRRTGLDCGIAIRSGTPSDAERLTAIFLAARRTPMSYLPALHSDANTRWWMQHAVLAHGEVLVATEGARSVGFAALGPTSLDHLYVAPALQSRGIGSALLRAAQARRPELLLRVFERNADARRFYARHGFIVTGRSDGAANEEGLPDLEMTWRDLSHPQ